MEEDKDFEYDHIHRWDDYNPEPVRLCTSCCRRSTGMPFVYDHVVRLRRGNSWRSTHYLCAACGLIARMIGYPPLQWLERLVSTSKVANIPWYRRPRARLPRSPKKWRRKRPWEVHPEIRSKEIEEDSYSDFD